MQGAKEAKEGQVPLLTPLILHTPNNSMITYTSMHGLNHKTYTNVVHT